MTNLFDDVNEDGERSFGDELGATMWGGTIYELATRSQSFVNSSSGNLLAKLFAPDRHREQQPGCNATWLQILGELLAEG